MRSGTGREGIARAGKGACPGRENVRSASARIAHPTSELGDHHPGVAIARRSGVAIARARGGTFVYDRRKIMPQSPRFSPPRPLRRPGPSGQPAASPTTMRKPRRRVGSRADIPDDAGMSKLVLAIDQGTSATKCLAIDPTGAVVDSVSCPLGETTPHPGWVEQDAEEVWNSVGAAVATLLRRHDPARVVAVGLSTQRESLVLWDKATGRALSPLLSWQDQRTAELCRRIGTPEVRARVRALSGLPLDPMFSAAKAAWLLDEFDPERTSSRAGKLALGTVDSWLINKLGGGHAIEIGNASRTQLLDTARGIWSEELCDLFNVPLAALPRVTPSTGPFPAVRHLPPLPDGTPVLAVLGDSHAALFGHGVRTPGAVKATYGTGSSVMGLVAGEASFDPGTCLTIAWQIGDAAPALAAEGNIRSAGATLKWLSDLFQLPVSDLILEGFASPPSDVAFVPAFNGLSAPYWDDAAVALIAGFRLGTRRGTIFRAALEAIAHQVADVVESVERSIGAPVERLHADGGMSQSDQIMQLQADLSRVTVLRATETTLSGIGAARLAGVGAGLFDLSPRDDVADSFAPALAPEDRVSRRAIWADAVARAAGGAASAWTAPPPAGPNVPAAVN